MASEEIRWAIADAISAGMPKCGDCARWMKSSICPREHNVRGMSRGPSCNSPACDKFLAKDTKTAVRLADSRRTIVRALAGIKTEADR